MSSSTSCLLSPTHSNQQQQQDSTLEYLSLNNNSNKSSLVKRRFSATKMLVRAKNTLVNRNSSLDSTRRFSLDQPSVAEIIQQPSASTPSLLSHEQSSSSLNSLEKLNASYTSIDDNTKAVLSSKQKYYGLPLKRPFTIRRDNNNNKSRHSLDSSLSSSSNDGVPTTTATNGEEINATEESTTSNAVDIAEANILSGTQRPGSFATACDFQLANEKQNQEFHALFKSVEASDLLIQDYKCALHKDILLQGRLYVSEHHVCFKSNIFGWVTNLVINFDEIIQVEKKMTAKIIPNGIIIYTHTSKHVFASLLSRDQAYDQIVRIWNLPKRIAGIPPPPTTTTDNDTLLYEEGETDEEEEDYDNSIPNTDSAVMLSPPVLITTEEDTQHHQDKLLNESKTTTAIPSNSTSTHSGNNNTSSTLVTDNILFLKNTPLLATLNRPRAASDSYRERRIITAVMEPNNNNRNDSYNANNKRETLLEREPITLIKKTRVCPCTIKGEQYNHIALNETYPGTVEAMFKLLYNSDFLRGFLERFENFEHVQLGEWQRGGTREVIGKRRIKSSSTMGTKVVKTLFQEKRIHRKYPYYACVTAKKSMPDIPMGAVYSIQSRTCITRVNKDKVHILITFQVAFTKNSLVSSIIEKNAADDQLRQYGHLHSILNRPELIRDLVHDVELLQDLNMHLPPLPPTTAVVTNQNWVSKAMHYVGMMRLIHFIYLGFFLVLMTHCVLALRLQRITQRLDLVQQQQSSSREERITIDDATAQWISNKMDRVSHSLNQLQGQVQDYDERIQRMKKHIV